MTKACTNGDFGLVSSPGCTWSPAHRLCTLLTTVGVFLPEVTANGLVLWRLRLSSDQQLWCSVRDPDDAGELALAVCDPAADWAISSEVHADIGRLIDRSESLRDQLVADGWQVVDVDLDEPD